MKGVTWYDYISRKFLLALAAMAGAFYLAVTARVDSLREFSLALGVILGFYNGAEVATSYYNAKANGNSTSSSSSTTTTSSEKSNG